MPEVSIVLPCYNGARWLSDAIKSVLSQNYADLELIIVDDGSTDSSKVVINNFLNDPRVHYYYQNNQGFSKTINNGIKKSKGNFIGFIGQDDIYLPHKIKTQLEWFKKYPDTAVVYSNYFTMNSKGKVTGRINPRKANFSSKEDLIKELFYNNFLGFETVLVKKSTFGLVGLLDESMYGFSDHDLWLRLVKDFQISYLDGSLVKKRIHDNQISTSKKMEVVRDEFLLIKKAVLMYPFLESVTQKKVSVLYYQLAIIDVKMGDFSLAKKRLLRNIRYQPWNVKSIFIYFFPKGYSVIIESYTRLLSFFIFQSWFKRLTGN